MLGIKKICIILYYLMGNGLVERFNQIFLKMLGILEYEQKVDWKLYVVFLV